MLNRLRIYLLLIVAFAGFSVLVGFSIAVVAPLTAAEALEEAIRGADTPDEVRSRIADYYSSTTVNRLLLCASPGLVAAILAGLALYELVKYREENKSKLSNNRSGTTNSSAPFALDMVSAGDPLGSKAKEAK